MKYLLLLITLYSFSFNSFSFEEFETTTLKCRNSDFLKNDFFLNIQRIEGEKIWKLIHVEREDQFSCLLKKISKVTKSSILVPQNESEKGCYLTNLSRPDIQRDLISIELKEKLMSSLEGYAIVTLDNTFAEYGPKVLRSFVYCREF